MTNVICVIRFLNISGVFVIQNIRDEYYMKANVNLTMESVLLKEIDRLRGREKRSTFMEYLVRLGLKVYKEADRSDGNTI